jgi:hypothetical protein
VNADFRRGWRAACAAAAETLRHIADTKALRELADRLETRQPPGTMTVVDEEGKQLL